MVYEYANSNKKAMDDDLKIIFDWKHIFSIVPNLLGPFWILLMYFHLLSPEVLRWESSDHF